MKINAAGEQNKRIVSIIHLHGEETRHSLQPSVFTESIKWRKNSALTHYRAKRESCRFDSSTPTCQNSISCLRVRQTPANQFQPFAAIVYF